MSATTAPSTERPARIGIVCQSEGAAANAVPQLIEQLGLEPLKLAGVAGTGLARFDRLRDLDFAIVVLSADQSLTTPGFLLEIGFLLGSIGRERICLVLDGQPALMPELDGAKRVAVDDGGLWRLLLAREMKKAGLAVDLNRAV